MKNTYHSNRLNTEMANGLGIATRRKPVSAVCKAVTGAFLAASMMLSFNSALANTTVIFHPGTSNLEIEAFISGWEALGADTLMRVPLVNGVVIDLPEGLVDSDLIGDPAVASVESDRDSNVLTMQGSGEGGAGEGGAGEGGAGEGGATTFITPFPQPPKTDRPWGILEMYDMPYDPALYTDYFGRGNLPVAVADALFNAKHVKIAVFDTGIDYTHNKLDKVVAGGIDLVNMVSGTPIDDNGHGTHIAGTLVAKELGLAQKANLYSVKILDENAAGESSTLVMALQWSLDNNMDVVNMSVGFREDHPLVRLAVENAYDAGLVMVAAVGNYSNWHDFDGASGEGGAGEGGAGEGGAASTCDAISGTGEGGAGEGGATEDTSCFDGELYSVMYPAKYPETIAVGAMDSDYTVTWFSNTGPETDILAPGADVVSLNLYNGYGVSSGTSMSTPHVTAAVALMMAHAKGCGLELAPAQVADYLKSTTTVYGGVNLLGALALVEAYCVSGAVSGVISGAL